MSTIAPARSTVETLGEYPLGITRIPYSSGCEMTCLQPWSVVTLEYSLRRGDPSTALRMTGVVQRGEPSTALRMTVVANGRFVNEPR